MSASILAAGWTLTWPALAQERYATRLCERFWGGPEMRAKLRFDCDCIGRYLEQIQADPIDVEVHLRMFASVYTGKVQEEAEALRGKLGAKRYQEGVERSPGFLSAIMIRGGCRLEPS